MERNTLLVAAVLLVGSSLVLAGVAGTFVCRNGECKFTDKVSFGGGFRFEQMTGYCVHCQKFVSMTWPRGKTAKATDAAAPRPLGKIWDPASKRTLEIHKCPDCSGPFLPVNQEDLKNCPKCGSEGKFNREIMFD